MINNLDIIKPLLNFEKKGDFYMLYVFKRKKDQPEAERDNHQSVRTIKTYCIESLDHLERRWAEIQQLCEMFKARAYIHVQKQNHFDVSLNMMVALAQRIQDGNTNQKGLFDSVVGQIKTQEKRWIIDIDTTDLDFVSQVEFFIQYECRPDGPKIESRIPTKNGYHIITKRFDVKHFSEKYPEIDIQKKNPTLLYYPDSLDNEEDINAFANISVY
jgi:mRNA-degrading endonuclease HigB of HigAB toxin-antitoxin module